MSTCLISKKRKTRKEEALAVTNEEAYEIKKQNKFGLNVISFSLLFIALLMFILSLVTSKGGVVVGSISAVILLSAFIPYFKAKKIVLVREKIVEERKLPQAL